MMRPALFDPGLQPERTRQAWQRTLLSIGIASLVGLRILPDVLGFPITIAVCLVGLLVAGVLGWMTRIRYDSFNLRRMKTGEEITGGGTSPLIIASTVFFLGAAAAAFVILR